MARDTGADAPSPPWWQRLAWMLALWLAGVAALGAIAYALRGAMALVGLTA
jgi:hypothetical protein